MKESVSVSPVEEINFLHGEVLQQTESSKKCLHAALEAAWRAGKLLLEEQRHVRHTMGAAWGQWLDEKFHGSRRTAQNYMQLANTVKDVSVFKELSLRQVYLRLGIATEPKCRADSPRVASLPPHVRLANKLLVTLGSSPQANPEQSIAFRQDLRALYERLCRLFEPDASTNYSNSSFSNKGRP